MSVQVGFIGGPLDGRVVALAEPLSHYCEVQEPPERDLAATETENKRLLDTPIKLVTHRYTLSQSKRLYIYDSYQ